LKFIRKPKKTKNAIIYFYIASTLFLIIILFLCFPVINKTLIEYNFKDIDEFIENIPYDETRNYIKKVMKSYYFYQMLYP